MTNDKLIMVNVYQHIAPEIKECNTRIVWLFYFKWGLFNSMNCNEICSPLFMICCFLKKNSNHYIYWFNYLLIN